jgi:hypothetical protein
VNYLALYWSFTLEILFNPEVANQQKPLGLYFEIVGSLFVRACSFSVLLFSVFSIEINKICEHSFYRKSFCKKSKLSLNYFK